MRKVEKQKPKILFWIGNHLAYIGIAKYLQDLKDCEIFAIVDYSYKANKFFENQKMINFKKIWYYRDEIIENKKDQIDIQYLKSFEEKYKINLWGILYGERYFSSYNLYRKFTKEEILEILESECKFFERVFKTENFDHLMMKVTDNHQNYIFHHMCKVLKIDIISFDIGRFANRTMMCSDVDKLEQKMSYDHEIKNRSEDELLKYMKSYSAKMGLFIEKSGLDLTKKINVSLKYLKTISDKKSNIFFGLWGRTPLKLFYYTIKMHIISRKRKYFLDNNCIKKINDEKIIYFPLHFEPERVLSYGAPYYENQLEVIINIAKSIPINYKLYVKDHPAMSKFHWREINYYQKIIDLPNVELVHPSISNESIFKKCDLVTTIGGTSGLESLFYGVPSVVFSDVVYSVLSFVERIKSYEDLPEVIKKGLKKKVDFKELNQYVSFIERNTFEFDLLSFTQKIGKEVWYGGILDDDELDEKKMKKHLEKHEEEYNILVTQILKKIN